VANQPGSHMVDRLVHADVCEKAATSVGFMRPRSLRASSHRATVSVIRRSASALALLSIIVHD
jgi:hypothetical protein